MVKKSFLLSVLALIFAFNASFSFAAEELSQRWVCLEAKRCDTNNSGCLSADVHKALVSVRQDLKPMANADTYVIECLATPQGQICTTGTSSNDQKVYKTNNVARLASVVQYQFQGIFQARSTNSAQNPTKSSNGGVIGPFEWRSYTPGNIGRKFLALNFFDPKTITGSEGGQQQGTFSFDNASQNCVSISWDPYGRIFDSQTLEPIPSAIVELQQKRENGQFTRVTTDDLVGGSIINPQITKENGDFNFVVPDNTYKLKVSRNEYTFPNVPAKLNSAYSRIYSDIYRGEDILQQGRVQHRDIPLDHVSGGKTYPLVVDYFYESDKFGKGIIEGYASHPFVSVKAYSVKLNSAAGTGEPTRTRYRLIKSVTADKEGKFKVEIDQSGFDESEVFGELDVQKADLTQNSLSQNLLEKLFSVQAAEMTTMKFDPIPTYLEGYTYNSTGEIMPNTTVGIYLTFSENPYYQTQSDENGYFKISSENLPNMAYKIRYGSVIGAQTVVSTSKFIAQNAQYLVSNNVKLNTYKDVSGNVQVSSPSSSKNKITSAPTFNNDNPLNVNENKNKASINTNTSPQTQSGMLLLILIILLLLGGAGFLLGFYLLNRNKVPPPSQPY